MTERAYASPTSLPTHAVATVVLGRAGDRWEHDAHHAAHEVTGTAASTGRAHVQPLAGFGDGEAIAAPPSVGGVLGGGGTPLELGVRQRFGQRFGHDFSRVRVHTGPAAAQSARELGARAYTVGQDIVFGSGQYAPGTPAGRQVLAHELAHVVQQDGARGQGVARLQRLSLSDVLEFGAEVAVGPAAGQVVHAEKQLIDDLVASVRESPQHVMEFFEDEVWEQIKAHWLRIIGVTLGLMAAEAVAAALAAAPDPTLLTKVIAAILEIVILAILGYFAAVELTGVYEEGSRWLALVGQAKGQAQKISEASRAFVRMVWHIVLAVLAVAGVRARIRGLAVPSAAAGAGEGGGSVTGGAGAEGGNVTPLSSHPQYQPRFQSQAEPAPTQPSASAFGQGGTARQLAPAEAPLPQPAPSVAPAPAPSAAASAAPKVGGGVQVMSAAAAGMSSGTGQQRKPSQLHQGSIHVQGNDVRTPPNFAWSQPVPATKTQGLGGLAHVKGQCTPTQLRDRGVAFARAERFIEATLHTTPPPLFRTFQNPEMIRDPNKRTRRVDIEIVRGTAFA